jgi:DNA-directed RNA polymerase subunit RPC12/RpoP
MAVQCANCGTEMFQSEGGGMICPACGARGAVGVTKPVQKRWDWLSVILFFGAASMAYATWEEFQTGGGVPWIMSTTALVIIAMFVMSCTGGRQRQMAAVLVALVTFVAGLWAGGRYEASVLAPFQPRLAEYMSLRSIPGEPTGASARGKLLALDVNYRRLDRTFFALPKHVRAHDPSDVGTVALVDCSAIMIGRYGTRGNAYQYKCDVSAYDPAAKQLLARKTIMGEMPPSASKSSQTGPRPDGDVARYIASLVK